MSISIDHHASPAHLLSEVVATAGLLLVIFSLARTGRSSSAPAAVGAYIGAAYWFTSVTVHLIAIGGSDAGISAALRARELDPACDATVVVGDSFRTSRSAGSRTTSR